MRLILSAFLVLGCAISTNGFSPATKSFVKPSMALSAQMMALLQADNEEDAAYLLHKAEECALSDSCSIDDAKVFLREVISLESGCAAGTLAGHGALLRRHLKRHLLQFCIPSTMILRSKLTLILLHSPH